VAEVDHPGAVADVAVEVVSWAVPKAERAAPNFLNITKK